MNRKSCILTVGSEKDLSARQTQAPHLQPPNPPVRAPLPRTRRPAFTACLAPPPPTCLSSYLPTLLTTCSWAPSMPRPIFWAKQRCRSIQARATPIPMHSARVWPHEARLLYEIWPYIGMLLIFKGLGDSLSWVQEYFMYHETFYFQKGEIWKILTIVSEC